MFTMEVVNEKVLSRARGTNPTMGKGAMGIPSRTIVQAQLETTQPGDRYEQEADAAAALVMRRLEGGSFPSPSVQPAMPSVACFGGGGIRLSTQMESQLSAMSGGGHSMPAALQQRMESGFGRSLSDVRLHTDAPAADLSAQLHAKAFAHGNDIYFAHGQYQPETSDGQHLIAHEVAHTMQQSGVVGREPNALASYEPTMCEIDFTNSLVSANDNKGRYDDLIYATKKTIDNPPVNSGITVAIVLSSSADHNGAFAGEFSAKRIGGIHNLVGIHGRTVGECERLLIQTAAIGPLQNLIIAGHGNWNKIKLSDTEFFTIESEKSASTISFFKTVDGLMAYARDLIPGLQQSIYLDACLTNSHRHEGMSRMNFKEVFESHISGKVKFYANSASSGYQIFALNSMGQMTVQDSFDPTILKDVYGGDEYRNGRFRSIAHEWFEKRNVDWLKTQLNGVINEINAGYGDKSNRMCVTGRILHFLKDMIRYVDSAEYKQGEEHFRLIVVPYMLYMAGDYLYGNREWNGATCKGGFTHAIHWIIANSKKKAKAELGL